MKPAAKKYMTNLRVDRGLCLFEKPRGLAIEACPSIARILSGLGRQTAS